MYCSVHIYNDNWFCSFYRERAHVQCHFLAMLALTACRTSWSTSLLTMASASTSSALVSVAWCILALVNLQLSFLMRLNLLYFLLADFYFKIFSKTAKMFLILLWLMAVLQFYAGYWFLPDSWWSWWLTFCLFKREQNCYNMWSK